MLKQRMTKLEQWFQNSLIRQDLSVTRMEDKTMRKLSLRRGVFILLLCISVLSMVVVTANAIETRKTYVSYPQNESGQTFGSGLHSEFDNIEKPDLIQAAGIDGTEGYVLKSDLYGTGPLHKPQNEEEVFIYMEQLDALIEEAKARGDKYVYTIPLYKSDGITIIGEFGISIPLENPQLETQGDLG